MDVPLNCGCIRTLTVGEIPSDAAMQQLQGKQLRAFANAHNVGPTGASGSGFSQWRNKANHSELLSALGAHRDGKTIQIANPNELPPALQGHGSLEKIPQLLDAIELLTNTIDPELIDKKIEEAATKQLAKYASVVQQLSVTVNDATPVTLSAQHKDFERLLRMVAARVHVMLVGPAGGGKTEACLAVAKSLNRDFEIISVGPQTMQSELAGYKNAQGRYIASAIYRAYKEGRVLILDEMDAGHAGVFTFLNSTLSNAYAGYPVGVVERNPNFLVLACANTFGSGADMVYIGRNQLDGATLDRYVPLVWDYDHDFELSLALQHNPECKPWVERVWHYRSNMMKQKIRHIISPRASIYGARLLHQGFQIHELEEMLIFKGLNKENADKIRGKVAV